MTPVVIGLSGKARAGKDTAAAVIKEVLEGRGLRVKIIALADSLRQALPPREGEPKEDYRKRLIDLGRAWRERYGELVLVVRAVHKVAKLKDEVDAVIIPDLRKRVEREEILRIGGRVYTIVADDEVRYARMGAASAEIYKLSAAHDETELEADQGPNTLEIANNDGMVEDLRVRLKNLFDVGGEL